MNRPDKTTYYLDHAAATPMDASVFDAMKPFLTTQFANPSSLYMAARSTRLAIDTARATIARILGAKPTEIVFTSGGTESNNLAIQGVLRAHPGTHWVTTAIEHDAVLAQTKALTEEGHPATVVPVPETGMVKVDQIEAAIQDDTVLISVMMANNEIGTIQPVADLAKLITKIRASRQQTGNNVPLYLHTDAVQAANFLDLHTARLGVDLMSISGSKIYGPKGTGFLYVRHSVELDPLQFGGGQERGRRSGTENVAGVVGLAQSFEITTTRRESEATRLRALRDNLLSRLRDHLPDLIANGDLKRRLPNNLNITIPHADGETLVLYLDNAGIMASTGSACSTGNLDPSHVLLAIGRTKNEAESSLRLTLGRDTTNQTIDYVAQTLPRVVERVRSLS
jgi:cysteine desulfurase